MPSPRSLASCARNLFNAPPRPFPIARDGKPSRTFKTLWRCLLRHEDEGGPDMFASLLVAEVSHDSLFENCFSAQEIEAYGQYLQDNTGRIAELWFCRYVLKETVEESRMTKAFFGMLNQAASQLDIFKKIEKIEPGEILTMTDYEVRVIRAVFLPFCDTLRFSLNQIVEKEKDTRLLCIRTL